MVRAPLLIIYPLFQFSFLHRIINHPVLVNDTDVHDFLELDSELPRSTNGQGISGSSAIKLLKNVGEAVGKLTFRMEETDEVCSFWLFIFFYSFQYFDLKDEELENWYVQGSRLYAGLSNLVLDQTGQIYLLKFLYSYSELN